MNAPQETMFFSREQRVEHQIQTLLYERALVLPLTYDQRRVLEVLQHHRGHARAIKGRELAARCGMSEREIKAAIRALIVEHRLLVASSKSSSEGGYYIVTSDEEQRQAASSVAKQIQAEAMRHRILSSPRETAELLGQLRIDVQQ